MNLKPRTLEKLQYFVGKVCSVFTAPLCRNFDELRAREHFVVRVEDIDTDGLWGTHPYNGTVSYFPQEAIRLITEEIVLDPNNPEHAKMMKEYQEKTGKPIMSDVSPHLAPSLQTEPVPVEPTIETPEEPAFVDINAMSMMARKAKTALLAMEDHKLNNL